MKAKWAIWSVVALVIASAVCLTHYKQNAPRREALKALQRFVQALNKSDSDSFLKFIVAPSAIANSTWQEQAEFLGKALRDEISPEGMAVLKREGEFGTLQKLFPQEASAWSAQASVKLEDCIAFKLERNGQRAEVVLVRLSTLNRQPSTFRIVRCNNVKQMAGNF